MSMKQLWAPWRMDYLTDHDKNKGKNTGCVFCDLSAEKKDRENLILHRGPNVFVILNRYPYNNGHLMVVPNRHVSDYTDVSEDELKDLQLMSREVVRALKQSYQPEGYNIGMNLGAAAGAGIKDHLHLHVVPRWNGDTNFMPVIADTKSMPQHLSASFDKLIGYFKTLKA